MKAPTQQLIPLLNLPSKTIAERIGTSDGYVRLLAAGKKSMGPKLAPAFARLLRERAVEIRGDAVRLTRAADEIDPPAEFVPAPTVKSRRVDSKPTVAPVYPLPTCLPYSKERQVGRRKGRDRGKGTDGG